jgi:TonB family protein
MCGKLAPALALCSMLFPIAAVAGQSPTDAVVATSNLRVSTGVKSPVVLDTAEINLPQGMLDSLPAGAQVGVELTVDQHGIPENIRVVKSLNSSMDASVIDAVRQFRFRPGTMDNKPIPVDLNLTLTITR